MGTCGETLWGTVGHKQGRAKFEYLLTCMMGGCALGMLLSVPQMVVSDGSDLSVTRKILA